jgi:hypothetical protein
MSSSPHPNTKIHLHLNYPPANEEVATGEEAQNEEFTSIPTLDSSIPLEPMASQVSNQQEPEQGEILTTQPLEQQPQNPNNSFTAQKDEPLESTAKLTAPCTTTKIGK